MSRVAIPHVRRQQSARLLGGAAWWQIPGQTCIAAYQPKGAASLAASYVNLANPGTNDAAPGVAPGWTAADGWVCSGSSWLDTGLTPALDQSYSVAVRFSGASASNRMPFGMLCGRGQLYYNPRRGSADDMVFQHGVAQAAVLERASAGVAAIAGAYGFFDGSVSTGAMAGFGSSGDMYSIYVGAYNNAGSPGGSFYGGIQAVVIYSTTLSAADVATLTAAMEVL